MRELKFRIWQPTKNYIYFELAKGNSLTFETTPHIEQYTGLKDKNGKEIYEGDIIDDGVSHIGKVFFNQIILAYVFEYEVDGNIIGSTFIELYTKDIEVIGNIHENPELLENKQ